MVRLGKLKEKTLSSSITFAGEKLSFEYRPGALTQEYYDVIMDGMGSGNFDAVVESLLLVLVDWDLEVSVEELVAAGYYDETDDDDSPVREVPDTQYIKLPLELSALKAADAPMPLFGMLNEEIRNDSTSGGKGTKKGR